MTWLISTMPGVAERLVDYQGQAHRSRDPARHRERCLLRRLSRRADRQGEHEHLSGASRA